MFDTQKWEIKINILLPFLFLIKYKWIPWFQLLYVDALKNIRLKSIFVYISMFVKSKNMNKNK